MSQLILQMSVACFLIDNKQLMSTMFLLACNPSKPLGMESRAIANAQINASHGDSSAASARLGTINDGGWIAPTGTGDWIQIDLLSVKNITAVATQGHLIFYTSTYSLSYSSDGANFTPYEGDKEFSADQVGTVRNELIPPIKAKLIRLIIKGFKDLPLLKMELYGCD